MPAPLVSVDVEASGPCPEFGDMVSFAAIVIAPGFEYSYTSTPIMRAECERYDMGAYKVLGITREQHEKAEHDIRSNMEFFNNWAQIVKDIAKHDRLLMVSDNPGFDFMWMAHACHKYLGYCPFGHTARRIGDMYSGLRSRPYETQGWKKLREAPHDHTPYNDALGNAQAVLKMWDLYGSPKAKADMAKYGKLFQQDCLHNIM